MERLNMKASGRIARAIKFSRGQRVWVRFGPVGAAQIVRALDDAHTEFTVRLEACGGLRTLHVVDMEAI